MKRLAALLVLGSVLSGCSFALSLADLKSGKYQGIVVKKSAETSSHVSTMAGGPPEIIWERHYYLDVQDDAGMIQRLEVRQQAFNAVSEGTRLPLDDLPPK